MDTQKKEYCHFGINYSLFILIILAVTYGSAIGATKPVEITVIGSAVLTLGNRCGTFEATYLNKKIEVGYALNNIKVYKGKNELKDDEWYDYLKLSFDDQKSAIQGKIITLVGRWENQKTFEAYKIYLPSDIKKIYRQ